jgi:sigma-B regulation protein RsbU (phosphoserine phosphatase)
MTAGRPSRILLSGQDQAAVADVHRLLEAGGYEVRCHLLGSTDPEDLAAHHLAVLESTGCHSESLQWCRRLRSRPGPGPGDSFLPVLFITSDHSPAARLASFEAGADTNLLRPFAAEELLAQVRAFLRIRDVHDRLADKTAEVHRINKRLQQAYQQIDAELELARRLQVSFLPQRLPEVPPARFAVHYLLCGQVGGDFYDVFRLDENHIGFYVADAMGHGVPASLLTIFVKKGVRAKEVFGQQYRLVPPGEVLQRLNKDLIDQALSETPFITMVYVLFNHHDGTLHFSRAGHPYPLHIPRAGPLQLWQGEGLLLGVFDAQFDDRTHRLQPGDKVLLYSDGVDNAAFEGLPSGVDSLLACAERHRALPIQEFVQSLARELFSGGSPPDDLTLLGLEMLPQ